MKHCPTCNSSFSDSHHICDFDGTELDADPDSRINARPRPLRLRQMLRSPKVLTSLAVFALFLVSALIVYVGAPTRSIPVVTNQPWQPLPDLAPVTQDSEPPATQINTPAKTRDRKNESKDLTGAKSTARWQSTTARSLARVHQTTLNKKRATQSEIARRKNATEESPKVVAVLKATWRFLKKPFKF